MRNKTGFSLPKEINRIRKYKTLTLENRNISVNMRIKALVAV